MALQKAHITRSGVEANYWKVSAINAFIVGLSFDVVISLWLNKAARDAGHDPIESGAHFHFTATKEELEGNLIALAYAKIKASEEVLSAGGVLHGCQDV